MGERTTFVYEASESADAVFSVEVDSIDRRRDLFDRFANTPMVYMVAGVPKHAKGSYDALVLCEYLQNESLSVGFLEAAFEDAEALARELENEKKPDENPDEDTKDDELKVEVSVAEQVRESEPAPGKEKAAAPVIEAPTPEPTQEVVVDLRRSQAAVESAAVVVATEQVTAAAEARAERYDTGEVSVANIQETKVETSGDMQTREAAKTTEAKVEMAASESLVEQNNDLAESEEQQTKSEASREVLVEQATQAVLEMFEEQAVTEPEPIVVEIERQVERSLEDSESLKQLELSNETVAESEVIDDEQIVTEPQVLFELPELPLYEAAEPDDEANEFYAANELVDDDNATVTEARESEPTKDDVIEHVLTLTAILQAEQATETENEREPSTITKSVESTATEQIDESRPAATTEIVELNKQVEVAVQEVTALLKEIDIAPPETIAAVEVPELNRQTQTIIQKIEILKTSVTAEECREAVEALQHELAALLTLLGQPNASAEASRLMRHWQYDLESLKRYMAMLQKALVATQRVTLQTSHANGNRHHRNYGARAVRMVVSLVKHPKINYQAAAA